MQSPSSDELPRLIDSHCHIARDIGGKLSDQLVSEALHQGIIAMINVGVDLDSLPALPPISEKHAQVFHTVGVHPHEASKMPDDYIEQLRTASQHPKCRAIGEIGLDYYYNHSPADQQIPILNQQLDLALEVGLPVVIHARDAEGDLLDALTRYAKALESSPPSKRNPHKIPGVIHCFTGTRAFGERCIELGFYISFSGILTFKTADALRDCAVAFPLDRILVETDSPYLAPIPYRGKPCEPQMVRLTAQKLAECKRLSIDEVARATTANAQRVFGIEPAAR